jgi:threonine dehydratase
VYAGEPDCGGPGLRHALLAGQRNEAMHGRQATVADGLRCLTGAGNWEHISAKGNVDGVFGVSEEQIKAAVRIGVEELGCVIEPSAAVGLAVVLFSVEFARDVAMWKGEARMKGAARVRGEVRIGVVLTGGNVGLEDLLTMVPDLDLSSFEGESE